MLKIYRKKGQIVFLDSGKIKIKLLSIGPDLVTLGFIAPSHIDIDREEIFVKRQAETLDLRSKP